MNSSRFFRLGLGVLLIGTRQLQARQQPENSCTKVPSGFERSVMDELNQVRQDPPGYSFHLEDLEESYHGTDRTLGNHQFLNTHEGVAAVKEAIRVLKATTPRKTLIWNACLALSADDHVKDTGPTGIVGHEGSHGETFEHRVGRYLTHYWMLGENIDYGASSARDVVMQLLIDDGVPDRGHRNNILESHFNAVGVACGDHKIYGTQCVMDFARE
jgi:uncharacterized protein YkwD